MKIQVISCIQTLQRMMILKVLITRSSRGMSYILAYYLFLYHSHHDGHQEVSSPYLGDSGYYLSELLYECLNALSIVPIQPVPGGHCNIFVIVVCAHNFQHSPTTCIWFITKSWTCTWSQDISSSRWKQLYECESALISVKFLKGLLLLTMLVAF